MCLFSNAESLKCLLKRLQALLVVYITLSSMHVFIPAVNSQGFHYHLLHFNSVNTTKALSL